jgi:DNA-binding MarR family transcriptional regulator
MCNYSWLESPNMSDQLDDLHLEAWRNFITAHARLIDAIDRTLVSAEQLPLHWYDVLIELVEAPEHRLRLHELADRVVLSRSGLTRLLDRLEAAGLLTRQPDPADRRGAYAVLTDKGREAIRRSWPVYARGIQQYFARHVSDDEARLLIEVFTRLLDAVKSN